MITFDGTTKLISFDTLTTSLDVKEMYSRWVDWLLTSDNSKYQIAIRTVGGDPTTGSNRLGITYFLMNGWKLRPYPANHRLVISGNLYSEDGSETTIPPIGAYTVLIVNSVSNLIDTISTGGSSLLVDERNALLAINDKTELIAPIQTNTNLIPGLF